MEPKIYTSKEHHIRNAHIDPNALFVLRKLHDAGYTSYLVGGSVRDLLMHKKPKDFDISTSALPEEVKALFRRCILVGRRFRLAHVRFGKECLEVATFRAGDPQEAELIVRDNLWGDPHEDVMRRDFTCNGLFYDPIDHRIIDYVGGFEDIQNHYLRVIGEPEVRFKQDPVRMLRLLKFQARYQFKIQEEASTALERCREEIVKSSPARVLEEVFRMLESKCGAPFFRLLVDSNMLQILFPKLSKAFVSDVGEEMFKFLEATDSLNVKYPLDRALLAAALLFPILNREVKKQEELPHLGEIMDLSHFLIYEYLFQPFSHFPRRIRLAAHAALHLQYRLTPLKQRKVSKTRIIRQKAFPLALKFLKIRSLVHPDLFKTYEMWKKIARQDKEERHAPLPDGRKA